MGHQRWFFLDSINGFRIFAACLFVLSLSGCSQSNDNLDNSFLHKMPIRLPGASDAEVIDWHTKFSSNGIKLITIGQDYLISIPSAMIFADQSPRLTWKSYSILNDVTCFLKQFRKIDVHVISYSNCYLSVRREQALTSARAKVVANYLWSQGIDSRFIFTEGAGSIKPIIASMQGGDRSNNSRIEITFRDVLK